MAYSGKKIWKQEEIDSLFNQSKILFEGFVKSRSFSDKENVRYYTGEIIVVKVVKGDILSKEKIVLEWKEWLGAGCPHFKSLVPLQRKVFWYSLYDSDDNVEFKAMPIKGDMTKREVKVFNTPTKQLWKSKK